MIDSVRLQLIFYALFILNIVHTRTLANILQTRQYKVTADKHYKIAIHKEIQDILLARIVHPQMSHNRQNKITKLVLFKQDD